MSAVGSSKDPVVIDSDNDEDIKVAAKVTTKVPSDNESPAQTETVESNTSNDDNDRKLASPLSQMEEVRAAAKRRWDSSVVTKEAKKQRDETKDEAKIEAATTSCKVPIKLITTKQPRRNSATTCPLAREHCRTMRELLGLEQGVPEYLADATIQFFFLSNYLVDFEYLLHAIPELVSIDKTLIFYGTGSDPSRWKQVNPSAKVVRLVPSDPPNSPTNPLPFRSPWGVHHTKMFLLGLSNGTLRVIIHTSNLCHGDLEVKAQGAYIQDFPLKTASTSTTTDFEKDLVAYLQTYHFKEPFVNKASLCDEIQRYDFSGAKVMLVASTPGRDKLDSNPKGYLQLSNLIRKYVPKRDTSKPIICQFSSIGSLSAKWLAEIAHKWDSAQQTTPKENRLRLVYPTVSEIRDSVEGYFGGGSVPGNTKNTSKPFLQPLYHKWAGTSSSSSSLHQPLNVPHIKTYYQLTEDELGMEWFCLTSHNLSKAAWGEVIMTDGGRRNFCRHWELGVFVCPQLLGGGCDKMIPAGGEQPPSSDSKEIAVPLPYPLHPTKYAMTDQPWAVDKRYTQPDRWGRTSLQG